MKQKVFDWEDLTEEEVFDVCLFMEHWKNGINYDALSEEWSYKLNWGNIPYSHVTAFLIKAIIEFLKGKNIVLMLPIGQLVNNKFY